MMDGDAADAAIEVEDLRKAYGAHEAVRGISFSVRRGEVFGLLGPNGAGKTTTVEILEGYRERTGGHVSVLGMDPGAAAGRAARADRDRAAVERPLPAPHRARGGQPLGRALPRAARRRRDDRAERARGVGRRSARARCRAASSAGSTSRSRSIGDPELVFLDEPTTGFDPAARRQAWETVRSLQELGQDRAAHHALPRRGAGARRPGGDRQGRRDPRRGRAGRARRRRRAATG